MGIPAEEVVFLQALDEGEELRAIENVAVAGVVAGVVGELDAVDGVDVEAEELEGEDGAFVAHIPRFWVREGGEGLWEEEG